MEFHAVKLGFTYFGCEVYRIEIADGKIKGIYLGKMLSRREKISVLLESIFYALLGGYFFGTPGYVMAVLASPDIEAKIGKPERDERKDFCYLIKKCHIKMKVKKGLLVIKCKKRWKFMVERNILKEIAKIIDAL